MTDEETKRKFKELLDKKNSNNHGDNKKDSHDNGANKTGGTKSHQKLIRRKSG